MKNDIFSPSMAEIIAPRRRAMVHHFKEGHCYRISSPCSVSNSGRNAPKLSSASVSWERQCTFVFLRKDGKHHIFRELNGGWTRTYTDAQLIGKSIQEVTNGKG